MEKSFIAIEPAQCAPRLMGKTENIVRALGVKLCTHSHTHISPFAPSPQLEQTHTLTHTHIPLVLHTHTRTHILLVPHTHAHSSGSTHVHTLTLSWFHSVEVLLNAEPLLHHPAPPLQIPCSWSRHRQMEGQLS